MCAEQITSCQGSYENVIEDSDNCYKVYRAGVSWHQALIHCQSDGASLARINDGVENTELLRYARRRGIFSGAVWLGFNQTGDNTQWSWQPEGDPLGWTAWAWRQPDDYNGEDCGSMFVIDGAWNDDDCEKKQPFMCMSSKISKLHYI